MKKIAVMLYPHFSLQEITTLTACLTIWFGQTIDFIGSRIQPYESEDGFQVIPARKVSDADPLSYDCIILPGIMNPLPALYDDELISFLRRANNASTLFAAISSAPLLLAKAGLLEDVKYTAGFFMQMVDHFPFINRKNFFHQPIIEDGNTITAIGFAFREFAQRVLERLGYETGESFMTPVNRAYTEEELTFYWEDSDYQEFLAELCNYSDILSCGEQVSLSNCTKALWHAFYKGYEPDAMMDTTSYAYDYDQVEKAYDLKTADSTRKYFFIITHGKVAGEIYLKHMDRDKKSTEFGIALTNDSVKGKGFGTEAIRLVIDYAFNELGFRYMFANSVLRNARGQHILEKCGFVFTHEDSNLKYYKLENRG